jgi:hypothetical protein
MKFTRLSAFTLGVVITAASIGAVSFVNAAGNKQLKACANKKTGVMRYISKGSCKKKTERTLRWNQMGPQGLPGTAGTNGAAGAKGDTGATGAAGTNGTNGTLAITQQSVCDGSDADAIANEVCKIGMTGPGGGLIFFVDYNDEYATYDYLEAAPADAAFSAGASTGVWATTTTQCGSARNTSCQTATIYTETLVALTALKGSHRGLFGGKAATAAIVARHDAGSEAKNIYAAGVADDYAVNGKTDWWLPSKDELLKMQENLNNKGVGGFTVYGYWSSSETEANSAIRQSFFPGFRTKVPRPKSSPCVQCGLFN